jgi:hypothetical protein
LDLRNGSLRDSNRCNAAVKGFVSFATNCFAAAFIDGRSLQTRTGSFSVGWIGGMPVSAAGGTYIIEATANLSDGRVLKLNTTVQCKLPGS